MLSWEVGRKGPVKYKVLMVCMDNLCLSPLAAGLLNFAAEAKGLAEHLEVDSAGLKVKNKGESPVRSVLSTAENHGFVLTHEARDLDQEDLDAFDEILVLDESSLKAVLVFAGSSKYQQKVRLLTEYDLRKEKQKNFEDPRTFSAARQAEGFEELYEQLWYACMGFLKRAT